MPVFKQIEIMRSVISALSNSPALPPAYCIIKY
jgi:hypothetical protein